MDKEKKQEIKIDCFKKLYYDLKDKLDTDQDLFNRDISELIPIYFKQKIKERTLINIALRGEPGSGKSIVAIKIANDVNKLLKPEGFEMKKFIASDQGELIRLAKNKQNHNSCIEVDEFNPLISTGANATTEQKEYEFFSDLCRVYYVHRISCSPNHIADPNVNVVFDVMSKDPEKQRTFIKILYRNSLENRWVQLGVAWINVKEILEAEWCREYETKKNARVDLLTNHGLRDLRELEFNHITIKVTKKISGLLDAIDKKHELEPLLRIKAINMMQQIYQRPISFIAEDEIVKPARALLHLILGLKSITGRKTEDNEKAMERLEEAYKEELTITWNQLQNKDAVYKKYIEIMD